jgi:hypothetical protein
MPNDPKVTAYAADELMRFLVGDCTVGIITDMSGGCPVRDRL